MNEPTRPVLLITESPGDSLMLAHDASLNRPGHPERPDRLRAVWRAIESLPPDLTLRIAPTPADRAALERVHTAAHIDAMLARRGQHFVIDEDTAGNPSTIDAALLAAGAAIQMVDALLASSPAPSGGGVTSLRVTEEASSSAPKHGAAAFALVRPPGHHAERDRAMGFCFFNNIAVAAAHAISHHKLSRVLILDWDVHHGNGTQHIFEHRRDVLVFNIHEQGIWPGTGHASERGTGEGLGYTINVPLPPGSGDAEYLDVIDRLFAPVARDYRPELILVSAGFDAHERDPLGSMNVTTQGFAAMCAAVRDLADELCEDRLGLLLEGGYDLEGISSSVAACIRILAGESAPAIERDPSPAATSVINRAFDIQRECWSSL